MVSGIQILGIIFGLVISYFTFLHFKRGQFTLREFIGWEILWVVFMLTTIFVQSFQPFTSDLGAVRLFDLIVALGFIVVLSISFYTYVCVDILRKNLEKAIRDLALDDFQNGRRVTDKNGTGALKRQGGR